MRMAAMCAQSGARTDDEKSPALSWSNLVGDVLVGRDLISSDPGGTARGPIDRVEQVGKRVEVELEWVATNKLDFEGDPTDEWEIHKIRKTTFGLDNVPRLRDDGAIVIYCEIDPRFWTSTVILPSGNNLSRDCVDGA